MLSACAAAYALVDPCVSFMELQRRGQVKGEEGNPSRVSDTEW